MKKVILSIIALVSLLYSSNEIKNEQFINKWVKAFSDEMPKQINKHISMIGIIKTDKDIFISFMSDTKASPVQMQEFMNKNKNIFTNEWCNEKEIQSQILKKGYSLTNIYVNKYNKKLGEIKTTYNVCLKGNITDKYKTFLYKLTDEESEFFYKNFKTFEKDADYRRFDIEFD